MQARKQEVDFEETARQREAYWQLASSMPNGRTVDASQPLGHVIADVDRLVVRHLAERTARQLELPTDGRTHPAVSRVLEQFSGCEDDGNWIVDRLGQGDQADVFLVRRRNGRPIWQGYGEVVVKLYRTTTPAVRRTAQHEVESLRQLIATVEGRSFHGWSVHCPLPLYVCQRPLALVMTKVPGLPLNRCLGTDVAVEVLHSAGEAVVDAMERYWSAGGEIYGDLDLNNILCDLSGRSLSFVDPGIPEGTYRCRSVPGAWYPASRDLAYMLFDVAASVRASMGNPRIRQRQKHFVEASLRAFMKKIHSRIEEQRLLDEIHSCTQVHVKRIHVSWSPIGLFRLIVRQTASRCVHEMLNKLQSAAEGHAS
jgi:RIO-like serine/threonine protein kinase